jgi:predicted TIM-barrel fold metal-dependent hydrolase
VADLAYGAFDADNHYYEAEDAFTRHLPKGMGGRAMQWATIDGRQRLLVGGMVNRFIPNPTFDPIARPGSLMAFFQGKTTGDDVKSLFGELEPIRGEYRDREMRLKVMDQQGLEGCWLFPTLGVGMEEALRADPEACVAAFRAFNRWLDDDWGFAYKERIFAAPYFTLVDLDAAVNELAWALDRGARVICLRPAPVATPQGSTSPFTEEYDAFWSRVDEAGVTVAFHGGDGGYGAHVRAWEPNASYRAFFATPLSRVVTANRAITETMTAILCHRLLERHGRIRVASIENGSVWVKSMLDKVDLAAAQTPGWFRDKPSDTFHRQVWVSPFWEDDPVESAETIGVERTLFGSDWPHTEGLPEPIGYADTLGALDAAQVRRIMRDNALELTVPAP